MSEEKFYTIYVGITDDQGIALEDVFFPVSEDELLDYEKMVDRIRWADLDRDVIAMAMSFPEYRKKALNDLRK